MSGKKRKRSRLDPEAHARRIEQVQSRAKEKALKLLIQTLQTRADETHNIIQALQSAFGLHEAAVVDEDAGIEAKQETDEPEDERKETVSESSDQHNEVCEVCEKGGKLLCCDTCSLVFHLDCVRPKLDKLPRGKWSCAYCIADSVAKGDKEAARKAVATMKSISSRGGAKKGQQLSPPRHEQEAEVSSPTAQQTASNDGVVIVRSGRRYFVKQKLTTLGKFDTLDEAIQAYHAQTNKTPSDDEDELWCSYCLDDDNIEVCAFCGCKKCFGKNDTDSLLLCDGCDSEYHIYCLEPPLAQVPSGRWFCSHCLNRPSDDQSEQSMELEQPGDDSVDTNDGSSGEVMHDPYHSSTRGENGGMVEEISNGFGPVDHNDSSVTYTSFSHRHVESDSSEHTPAQILPDAKRIKLPSDSMAANTSYDLAAVVQLSSHMSSRLLDAGELAQLAGVRMAAMPDHLHTLLDALHQQKHLILKKLDKEESLARKRVASKDCVPSDDSSVTSPSEVIARNSHLGREHGVEGADNGSPRVSRKRNSRDLVEKLEIVTEDSTVQDDIAQGMPVDSTRGTSRQSKRNDNSSRSAHHKTPKSGTESAGSTISAAAVVSQAITSVPDRGRAQSSNQPTVESDSKPESSSSKPNRRPTPPLTTPTSAVQAPAADHMPPDYLMTHQHNAAMGKIDSSLPPPHIPSMALSHLASSLTTEQMLQIMGNDMFLNQSQFGGLGSLGFGHGFLDYPRHHPLPGSTLPPIPLPDFAGGGLTHMLRELNQRQFDSKSVRPIQDDLLIATLAAALSGGNPHYNPSEMYPALGQPPMRWVPEAQQHQQPPAAPPQQQPTPPPQQQQQHNRNNSADTNADSKSTDSSKSTRKYPIKNR